MALCGKTLRRIAGALTLGAHPPRTNGAIPEDVHSIFPVSSCPSAIPPHLQTSRPASVRDEALRRRKGGHLLRRPVHVLDVRPRQAEADGAHLGRRWRHWGLASHWGMGGARRGKRNAGAAEKDPERQTSAETPKKTCERRARHGRRGKRLGYKRCFCPAVRTGGPSPCNTFRAARQSSGTGGAPRDPRFHRRVERLARSPQRHQLIQLAPLGERQGCFEFQRELLQALREHLARRWQHWRARGRGTEETPGQGAQKKRGGWL